MRRDVFGSLAAILGMTTMLALVPAQAQPATSASGEQAARGSDNADETAQTTKTAQNETAPDAEDQSGVQGQLAEVVVTAEIRQEAAQSTPISMSVVTGDQIIAKGFVNMSDMQSITPNFTVNAQGSNAAQINIRGLGSSVLSSGTTPGVAVLRDGLLNNEVVGSSVTGNFYDLQNVSVLKGPQGTFIGASAIAGAVEITSRAPEFGNGVTGYADAQLGNYSDIKITGAANAPISDTVAARLAFNYETQGSFALDLGGYPGANSPYPSAGTHNDIGSDPGHIDAKNARLQVLWKPSDSFQALLKEEINQMQFGGTDEQINPATFINPITLVPTHAANYNLALHDGPWVYDQYLPEQSFYSMLQVNMLEMRFTLPDQIQIRSLSGYQRSVQNDYTGFVPPAYVNTGYAITAIRPDNYYSQEIDVISPTSWPVNFVAGASWFYRHTPVSSNSANETASTTFPRYTYTVEPNTSNQRTMGIYANVDWQMTQSLQLTLGVRDNIDNNFNYGLQKVTTTQTNTTALTYDIGHFKDNVPTGKIGVNWTPTQGELVYAFVARGYKAGGLSTGGNSPTNIPTAGPEKATDFEVGWKGSLLDHRLLTDVDAFYMNYQDEQQQVYNPTNASTQLVNLGSASKIYGVEVEFDGKFGPVIADLGGGYTHSALGSLTAIDSGYLPASATGAKQCLAGQVPPACFDYTVTGPTGRGYYVSVSGEQNVLSPKYMVNATLGYDFRIGNGKSLTAEVTEAYVASQFDSIFQQDNFYYMPAYQLFGANLTYTVGPWQVEAYGKNIFNKVYEVGNNGSYVFYGNPRQYGVRAQRTW